MTPSLRRVLMSAVLASLSVGCGRAVAPESPHGRLGDIALTACELGPIVDLKRMEVAAEGPVFLTAQGIVRARGRGCSLALGEVTAPGELLSVDDGQNLYVRPSAAVRDAMKPQPFGDVIARVDQHGNVTEVVSAGRGIWTFIASPQGTSIAVSACGPTGLLSVPDLSPRLTSTQSSWEATGGVFTDEAVFWSTTRACEAPATTEGQCHDELIRVTAEGETNLGAQFLGPRARLFRCGRSLCSVVGDDVLVVNETGELTQRFTAAELGLREGEHVLSVGGASSGLYAHVSDGMAARVLFLPW